MTLTLAAAGCKADDGGSHPPPVDAAGAIDASLVDGAPGDAATGDAATTDASPSIDASTSIDAPIVVEAVWTNLGQADSADGTSERVMGGVNLAVDDSGGITAVWRQGGFAGGSSQSRVWGNHYTPGSGWGTAQMLQGDPSQGYGQVLLVGDADGSAMAIWTQQLGFPDDPTPLDLWANRFVPGAGWTGATRLEDADGAADMPVAWIRDHRIDVAWRQSIAGVMQLRTAHFEPAGGWTPATQLAGSGADEDGFTDAAVDDAGDVVAMWIDGGGAPGAHRVWVNRLAAGAGWGTPLLLDTATAGVSHADLAGDRHGDAVAVWSRLDDGTTQNSVHAARYTAGGAWTSKTTLDQVSDNAGLPRVAIDDTGRATAVWGQATAIGELPWTSSSLAGNAWSAPEVLTPQDGGYHPSVVADPSGAVTAAWWNYGYSVGARRFVPGAGWQPPTFQQEPDDPSPTLAVAPGGRVAMAWQHDRWHLTVSTCCAP